MVIGPIHGAPGWVTNEKVTSAQMNAVNAALQTAVDKTGETSAAGGGISGEIDFLNASSAVFQSGSTLDVASGAEFLLEAGSNAVIHTQIFFQGGLQYGTISRASNYTIQTSDLVIFGNQGVSSSITLTLPDPSNKSVIIVKDKSGNVSPAFPLVIAQHASEKIEGLAASFNIVVPFGAACLQSDGTNWWVLS